MRNKEKIARERGEEGAAARSPLSEIAIMNFCSPEISQRCMSLLAVTGGKIR